MVGVLFLIGVEDVGGLKTGLGLDPSLTGACGLTLWVGDSPTQFVSESVIQLKASRPPVSGGFKPGVGAGGGQKCS